MQILCAYGTVLYDSTTIYYNHHSRILGSRRSLVIALRWSRADERINRRQNARFYEPTDFVYTE